MAIRSSIVPSIDLQDLSSGDRHAKLREACEDWGCFRLVNHGVPLTLMREMKRVARELLDLPEEVKRRNVGAVRGSGYFGPSKVNPLYQAMGVYDTASSLALDTFSSQLDASPQQREVIKEYAKAINRLAFELAGKIAECVGVKPEAGWCEEWPCRLRINKYDFAPETTPEASLGVRSHTDSCFLTILQDDENVGGLEVMPRNAGLYVPADPISGSLLVNLGDIAKVWSNGRFCNVIHKVQCREASTRVSIASFLLGPMEAPIQAPPELVGPEHPRLYVPFTYHQYMEKRLSSMFVAGEALPLFRVPELGGESLKQPAENEFLV